MIFVKYIKTIVRCKETINRRKKSLFLFTVLEDTYVAAYLEVMHVEKNIYDMLRRTSLNIKGKIKDTLNGNVN